MSGRGLEWKPPARGCDMEVVWVSSEFGETRPGSESESTGYEEASSTGGLRRSTRQRQRRMEEYPQTRQRRMEEYPQTRQRARQIDRRSRRASPRLNGVGRQRKHRRTISSSTAEASSTSSVAPLSDISSTLDCEVTIYRGGRSVEHREARCPICEVVLMGDNDENNRHIDKCLARSEGGPQEYEWAGETRVRSTALIEGGVGQLGVVGDTRNEVDEDIDVDDDDDGGKSGYGPPQYSEADLIIPERNRQINRDHMRTESDPEPEAEPSDPAPAEPATKPEAEAEPADREPSRAALLTRLAAYEALLREERTAREQVPRCRVCMDGFTQPLVSTNCWHVFCRRCWMEDLGHKKLCPLCMHITQPGDLRDIYL
ncbi:hypothetical protein GGF46_004863 [Coemansia sp. RSA 552]|nr:hypothetical protein GGF46_004863 [Coemansia sp. RSA 552]